MSQGITQGLNFRATINDMALNFSKQLHTYDIVSNNKVNNTARNSNVTASTTALSVNAPTSDMVLKSQ